MMREVDSPRSETESTRHQFNHQEVQVRQATGKREDRTRAYGEEVRKRVPSLSLQRKKVSEKLVGALLTMVFSAGHGKEYTLTHQISN